MGGIESQLVIGLPVVLLARYFIGQQAMRKGGLTLLQPLIRPASPHPLLGYTLPTGRKGRGTQVFRWLVDLAPTLLTSHPA